MKNVSNYIVVYDISSDKERGKVEKKLKSYGFRIQKSVFECKLKRTGVNEMIKTLEDLKIETGFVKVYRLLHSWKSTVIGKNPGKGIDEKCAYIV